MNVTI